MLNSAVFRTTIRPNFKKNKEFDDFCLLEEKELGVLKKKVVDTIDIKSLKYRDCIIMVGLIKVTIFDHSEQILNKQVIYEEIQAKKEKQKAKKYKISEADLRDLVGIPDQIAIKKEKIINLESLLKKTENRISEIEYNRMSITR